MRSRAAAQLWAEACDDREGIVAKGRAIFAAGVGDKGGDGSEGNAVTGSATEGARAATRPN